MNFGEAIELLKQCKKVCRSGWNGQGMYIFLVTPHVDPYEGMHICNLDLPGYVDETWDLKQRPVIVMRDATNQLVIGWLASQTDILAEDWEETT